MSSVQTLSVLCPTCQKGVIMTDEFPHRPFCSKRCQLIDLGDWAAENHRIPCKDDDEQDVWTQDIES